METIERNKQEMRDRQKAMFEEFWIPFLANTPVEIRSDFEEMRSLCESCFFAGASAGANAMEAVFQMFKNRCVSTKGARN